MIGTGWRQQMIGGKQVGQLPLKTSVLGGFLQMSVLGGVSRENEVLVAVGMMEFVTIQVR